MPVRSRTNILKSAIVRKAVATGNQMPRFLRRVSATEGAYRRRPVVIANSFPKSGTHLLLQVLEPLATARYGTFVASTPSWTLRERKERAVAACIRRSAPGELVAAHAFYSPEVARAIQAVGAFHCFVYRDPRDVVVSEAHYLADMSRWHRLHDVFSATASDSERLMMSITGLGTDDFYYPDVAVRFSRYRRWLGEPSCLALRYEDLAGPDRLAEVERIVDAFADVAESRSGTGRVNRERLVRQAIESIEPGKSHTFRRGGSSWRSEFEREHIEAFKALAGDLLVELGYETSTDW